MKIKRLVITSGPTREWIDPVRFISNPSSGQTGWQLARYAQEFCAEYFEEIILISGPGDPAYRRVPGIINIFVESVNDMLRAVTDCAGSHTLLIMAAAPADFIPAEVKTQKIKKATEGGAGPISIEFKPAPDILMSLKNTLYTDFIKVGFAAETQNTEENAKLKLKNKNLNFIAANTVYKDHSGFGSGENTLTVYAKDGTEKKIGPASKEKLAAELMEFLLKEH